MLGNKLHNNCFAWDSTDDANGASKTGGGKRGISFVFVYNFLFNFEDLGEGGGWGEGFLAD